MTRRSVPNSTALLAQLLLAAAGGALLDWTGAPAGWLCGAMVAVAVAAVAGLGFEMPGWLRDGAFVVLGISMGAGLTPEMLHGLARWPASIAALLISMPVIVGAVTLYLRRVAGWSLTEALVAAVPGALTATLAFMASTGADIRRVAMLQTLRVFLLVAFIPLIAREHNAVGAAAQAVTASTSAAITLAIVAVSLAAGLVFKRLSVPAPLLMGGFAVSGLLHATNAVSTAVPQAVTIPSFVITGALIGSRFSGMSLVMLLRALATSLVAIAIAIAVSALAALATAWLLGIPPLQTLLAFAPGGLEVMVIMAYVLGLEPAYVAAHHLVRFFVIVLLLPPVFRWLQPASQNMSG